MEKLGYDDYCLKNNKDYQFYYGSVPAGFTLYRVKGKNQFLSLIKYLQKLLQNIFQT
ncbi:hypothetical Protein psc5_07180 [Candidatus Phytoplasma solani]